MIESERQALKNDLFNEIPPGLALTGRVRDWGEGRLPVSCTVFHVEDSMEGDNGIEASWIFTSHALRNAAGCAIDLNSLRPSGTTNDKGLVASGAVSFMSLYSRLNETLRRGGVFKNGAVTVYLDYDNPDALAFLNADEFENAWIKLAMYVDDGLKTHPIKEKLAEAVDNGTVWLAKKQYDKHGERLYSNVCLEILLKSRATCLISNINLGLLSPHEIPTAFRQGAEWLARLHPLTGVGETGQYLSPAEDRQIGLGVIGLASFLAIHDVSYSDFVSALESIEEMTSGFRPDMLRVSLYSVYSYPLPLQIAFYLALGYHEAADIGRFYNFDRVFCVAPTATSFTKHFDSQGFSITPEISPPLSRSIERTSETFGSQIFHFHPNVQIASQVGWDTQWRLLNIWQRLMDSTGLSHSISANIWDTCPVDESFIDTFLASDLKTTYYRLATLQSSNDKSRVISDEALDALSYLPNSQSVSDVDFDALFDSDNYLFSSSDVVVCNLDSQYCEACAGD